MADRYARLRDRAHSQMNNILKFAKTITEETTLEAIKMRLETLDARYETCNEMEVQLLVNPEYQPITEEVDNLYYAARELLTIASNSHGRGGLAPKSDFNTTLEQFVGQQKTFYENVNTSQHVRLPKIHIEPFSGDYKFWASFHDLFKTSVHDNHSISDVHKLQMLNGLLKGEAAALIRHIAITEANYAEAWEKLCNRYNKLTPIVASLVQTFIDQRPCPQNNGNVRELRRISETSDEIIRGLRVLGPDAETRDPWLSHILLGKIDEETRQLWARESVGKDLHTFENLLAFLNKRCDALEVCEAATKRIAPRSSSKSFVTSQHSNVYECVVCKQQHPTFKCPEFKNMSYEARSKIIVEKNLCGNCLKKGHFSAKCYSKSSCLICHKRHHTLLHQGQNHETSSGSKPGSTTLHMLFDQPTDEPPSEEHQIAEIPQPPNNLRNQINNKVLHIHYSSITTVLPTAIIYIKSRTGELQLYRALLDSGSQTSFVTESCAQRLGLKRNYASLSIHGLASAPAGRTRGKIDMTIISRTEPNYKLIVTAHIIKNITNMLPSNQIKYNHAELQLELADPQFHTPNKIDVLLGADVFFDVLNPQKQIIDGLPALQSSKFGWLVAGSCHIPSTDSTNLHIRAGSNVSVTNEDLRHELRKFWEVEEVGAQPNPVNIPHNCEVLYEQTTTRTESGQFLVKLPFKEPKPTLGSSYHAAYSRLLAMERKFLKPPEFFELYKSFMDEYIDLGHMTCVQPEQIPEQDDKRYYLPHHAIIKPSSSTTKLRVVFDASCKSNSGISLNDTLQVGPNIQTDLSTILLRFRKHAIAFVADIEKMYRQILVDPDDANFQLILWRNNPTTQVKTYKLNTVTYGTACAPYLAVKSLKKCTEEFTQLYPIASHVINNDFYIDDLLTGCDNVQEAVKIKDQIDQILKKSGFNLRKWKSNSEEFLKSFSQHEVDNIPKLIEDDSSIKTLGIIWNAEEDTFSFKVQKTIEHINWTKRKILSTASKVYDPLGWLAPTVILFKMLLQKLWLLKLEWDADLPKNIINSWQSIYQMLPELEKVYIPRCLTQSSAITHLQIHAFYDASEAAYGCVVYLRSIDETGNISVNIINAKSKVVPLNQISLPRLELCGAVLLCKLVKFCVASLSYMDIEVRAWTDSMIVLHWLSDVPRRWKSFIGNRTAAILENIPRDNWHHIESKQNPADAITRGVKPQALPKISLWWQGPHWLSQPESYWPKQKTSATFEAGSCSLEERAKYINVFTEVTNNDNIISNLILKIPSWLKLRKILVYIFRFGSPRRRRQIVEQQCHTITVAELNDAENVILRHVQQIAFNKEITVLNKQCILSAKHQLASLDPFIDSNGLLRVGGRLRKSSLPYSAMHPIILPKDNLVCDITVRDVHVNQMHAGNSLTLNIVRNKFWMIGARNIIKRCLKSCTVCIRYRSHKNEQKMGDLPAARCNQSRPFLHTGLDYAGPFYIKRSKRNNSPVEKAYVAVFVCMSVKAVHLEVVGSLDTESFLAALKRFTSRRGSPEKIFCDNGSNFVGANKELKQLKIQITNQSISHLRK